MDPENEGDSAAVLRLARENDSLRAELASVRSAADSLRQDLARSQLRCEGLTETNRTLAAQSISDDMARQVTLSRAQLAMAQRQLEVRDAENERLRDATQAAATHDDVIRKLHRRLKAERSSGHGEVDQIRRELQALEEEMRGRTAAAKREAAKRWQKKCRFLKGQLREAAEKVKVLTSQLEGAKGQPAGFVVERERLESRLRQNEERLADEREKAQALQAKLQRAEEEVEQLRCSLRLFASDDRRIRQLGADRADVMQEIESLKGRVDRFERTVSGHGKKLPPRRTRKGRPTPAWRTFRDYPRSFAAPL
jgi:chromosome segregation ATPase